MLGHAAARSQGIGAMTGAMLFGSEEFIKEARVWCVSEFRVASA
jgi:threonine aldolase